MSTIQGRKKAAFCKGFERFVLHFVSALCCAGAAQADAALLLVDGSVGGFEAGFDAGGGMGGGQTREHAQLARSLGIEQLAVIISKLDTCAFSQVLHQSPLQGKSMLHQVHIVHEAG